MVVDQAGKPLSGVQVRLVAGDFDWSVTNRVDAVYAATSGSDGRFSIESLPPGIYIALAGRLGYLQATPTGFATLILKPGQYVTDYRLVLTRRAVIAGRVVDDNSDPVQGYTVQLEAPPPRPLPDRAIYSWATTDDRGEFRLVVAPGRYYLNARLFRKATGVLDPEIRPDGTNGAPFVRTYYPNAGDLHGASAIQVSAGQEVRGIEIRLARASAGPTLTINGTVAGAAQAGITVVNLFTDSADPVERERVTSTGPDGSFEFKGLKAGSYRVSAWYGAGGAILRTGLVDVELRGADRTGLQLVLEAGGEVTGNLELAGYPAASLAAKRSVRLETNGLADSIGPNLPAAEVGGNGSFRFTGVPKTEFRVIVEPMPEDGYLKEISLDGRPIPGGIVDFTHGAAGSLLKITIGRAAGAISGRILDRDGGTPLGPMRVFLAKNADDRRALRVTDGNFAFTAVPSGKYRLFAIDALQFVSVPDEEIVRRFLEAAAEVDVKDAERLLRDIPVWIGLPEEKGAH